VAICLKTINNRPSAVLSDIENLVNNRPSLSPWKLIGRKKARPDPISCFEFTAWLIFDVAKPFEQLIYSVLSSGHSPDNLIFKETKFYEKPIYITTR
jgi:hypothetical protein